MTTSDLDGTLPAAIRYAATHSPYYKMVFEDAGLDYACVESREDLARLPFTTSDDVVRLSPYLRAARNVTIYGSSGTTGRPKYSYFTPADLERAYERTALSLQLCGVTSQDVVAVAHGFGIWLIGTDFTIAAQKVGAIVLPVGKGPSAMHVVEMMLAAKTTYVATSPTYARRLAAAAADRGIDLRRELPVKGMLLSGETVSENLLRYLRSVWGVENLFSCYGSTECGTIGCESLEHRGLHLWADDFMFEILSLASDMPAQVGEPGELILTTLTHEGMPLVRYRTGDLAVWCQRTHDGAFTHSCVEILGRLDDAIVLEAGEKLWPYQVDAVMRRFAIVSDYQIVVREVPSDSVWLDHCDELKFLIVPKEPPDDPAALTEDIRHALSEASLDFSAIAGTSAVVQIELVDAEGLHQTEGGKTPRIVDARQFPTVRAAKAIDEGTVPQ